MAFELPKSRFGQKDIQIQKRKIPLEQIIATQSYNPLAQGIETAGNVIGKALQEREALRKQGQKLAELKQITGIDVPEGTYLTPEEYINAAKLKTQQEKEKSSPKQDGYNIPRGTDLATGKIVYSNSRKPGMFYADGSYYNGGALGQLTLKPLPSEQVEKETQFDNFEQTMNKVRDSYAEDLVGPISSRVGRGKQYLEGIATPEAATFYGNVQDLKNQLVYLRSGKQINEKEYERLAATLPNENLSPTDFVTKFNNFQEMMRAVRDSRHKTLSETGYRTPSYKPGKLDKINKNKTYQELIDQKLVNE